MDFNIGNLKVIGSVNETDLRKITKTINLSPEDFNIYVEKLINEKYIIK